MLSTGCFSVYPTKAMSSGSLALSLAEIQPWDQVSGFDKESSTVLEKLIDVGIWVSVFMKLSMFKMLCM